MSNEFVPYIEDHKVWDNSFKFYISGARSQNWYGLKTIADSYNCTIEEASNIQNQRNTGLRDLINVGDTILDVGANEGHVALSMALRAGNTGRVVAIEPVSYNADIIKYNFDINSYTNYTIMAKMADEKSGLVKYIREEMVSDTGIKVETIALDDLNIIPNVIKIDVEGMEVAVLRGSKNLLKYKPRLEIETHLFGDVNMVKHGFDPQELLDILYTNGYKVYVNGDIMPAHFVLRHNMFLHCV